MPAVGPGCGAALVASHDGGLERLGAGRDIAHPRPTDLDGAHAGADRSGRQVAVAVAAELPTALVAQPAEELVDLRRERPLQQLLRALADELLESVVGRGNRCGRGQDLVPCGQRRGLQDPPGLRAEVGDEYLEGYAVLVPAPQQVVSRRFHKS